MIPLQVIIAAVLRYWKLALVGLLVLAALGAYWSWHSRGEKLEAARADLAVAVARVQEWRDAAMKCSQAVHELELKNREFEVRLQDALLREPETVIKYRDRIEHVTEVVMSDDCPTAVRQMAEQLAGLPACEGVQ